MNASKIGHGSGSLSNQATGPTSTDGPTPAMADSNSERSTTNPVPKCQTEQPKLGTHLALIFRKQQVNFLNATDGGFDEARACHRPVPATGPSVDAEVRGIDNGDWTRVFNNRGSLILVCETSTDVQPGFVAIPSG